jgi:DNA polymerase III epsilon subunit-like protein/8-oxo-dGTP pyrophosphatase MutT (NUDIX family)
MSNWQGRIAVFDLETTGVDVDTSRIVSACIAVLEADGAVISRWDWLADPGIDIPEGAAAVHGITTERAQEEGRDAATVVAEITQTLRVLFGLGIPLTVYNAPYDLSLLDRECRRHRLEPIEVPTPVIDPLVIDKAVDRYRKGKRTLVAAAERYGVTLDDAHDAGADAIAAGRVAQAIARIFPTEVDIPFDDLHGRQEIWYRQQAESFQDYIRTSKGDPDFTADASWPLRPLDDPMTFEDTQPIPIPAPRPGAVPILDFSQFQTRAIEAPVRVQTTVVIEETVIELIADDDEFEGSPPPDDEDAPQPDSPEPPLLLDADADPFVLGSYSAGDAWIEEQADEALEQRETLEQRLATAPPPSVTPLDAPVSATRATQRPTVLRIAAAIVTDAAGRSLLVRKSGTTQFMQPGGKIEPGESALAALTRELDEELGLVVDPGETEYIGSFRAVAANEENTVIRAEVFFLSTPQEPVVNAEIEELLWVERLDDLHVELAPLTRDDLLPLWAARKPTLF